MPRLLPIGVAMALACALPAHAAQWKVCNRTPEVINVAIGYHIPGNVPVRSEGWWRLGPCGGCAVVLLPSETSDHSNVFLRAEDRNGNATVEGDKRLCVSSKPFKIRGNNNCEGRNFKTRGFRHTEIDLDKNYTTNVTGSRRCNL